MKDIPFNPDEELDTLFSVAEDHHDVFAAYDYVHQVTGQFQTTAARINHLVTITGAAIIPGDEPLSEEDEEGIFDLLALRLIEIRKQTTSCCTTRH